jgi:hypothetical protein
MKMNYLGCYFGIIITITCRFKKSIVNLLWQATGLAKAPGLDSYGLTETISLS